MYFLEERVDIKERIFILMGVISDQMINIINELMERNIQKKESYKQFQDAVHRYKNTERTENQKIFYATYAYADIFDGKEYEIVYPFLDISKGVKCRTRITSFLHESLFFPLGFVGHGHKSFCLVQFLDDIPDTITKMDVLEEHSNPIIARSVVLCSKETWNTRKSSL